MTILDGKALRLVLGSNVLDFDDWPIHGIIVSQPDLSFPDVREVLTDLPGQDGQFDETAYFGTRVVTLTGSFGPGTNGSRSQGLSQMAPFVSPQARPSLVFALDGDVYERQFPSMRVANLTASPSSGTEAPFVISWKCSDPIAYGLTVNEVDLSPEAEISDPGRKYPLTFPRVYPPGFGSGGRTPVVTNGNYAAWPILRIFGPCTGPMIKWLDPVSFNPTGTQVIIPDLVIAGGQYLEVNTRNQTVLLNGDPMANRYSFVDFANTSWGPLLPGDNVLVFQASAAATPSITEVLWSDAFLV